MRPLIIELAVPLTVYTFVCSETNEPTHINVTGLLEIIRHSGIPPEMCEIGDTPIEALKKGRLGVEEEHALKLPDYALDIPGIVCQRGEADHVLADGAHRLWRRWKRGDKTFPAWIVPEQVWRTFTIPNEAIGGDGDFRHNFNLTAKVR